MDESAETELTQVFEQQQLGSPTIEGLLKELYFNPMCIHHVFGGCPKLFLALWEVISRYFNNLRIFSLFIIYNNIIFY